MKAVIQRVKQASVEVDGAVVGKIGQGMLILLGVAEGDTEAEAETLARKTVNLRIFSDENGKMNRSVTDVNGEVLVVSQFTLLADCRHGNRPDFFAAAKPQIANALYKSFRSRISQQLGKVESGVFGADMCVSLVNDGPVTILLDTNDLKAQKKDF